MEKIFKYKIAVRWSDLDPNLHMANRSYMSFTASARMETLVRQGITLHKLSKWGIGPVIFEEKFNFFKEILPHTTISIHTKMSAVSEDGVLFKFEHDLYDEQGEHKAKSVIFGCWLDLKARKMAKKLPEDMQECIHHFISEETQSLSMSDLKSIIHRPQNISPSDL